MQIIFAGFPKQSVALGPTSRQWDCSGERLPNTLGEASANDGRIHLGKTGSVLQLFINVKYWWVKKITWLYYDLVLLKNLVCSVTPILLPQVDSSLRGFWVRLLWSRPTFHLGAFSSIHVGVSATTITSPLCSSRLCMSLGQAELFICINVSVLNGVFWLFGTVYVGVTEARCLSWDFWSSYYHSWS